jgi:hypothetical protein
MTVKVQCGCGQRFAFDVEPVHGRMPARVACPSCGVDGTDAANENLAQNMSAQGAVAYATAPVTIATPPPIPAQGLRIASASPPVAETMEAPPVSSAPAAPPPIQPQRFVPRSAVPQKGKDGWDSPEQGINKLGTTITTMPAVLGVLALWGIFGDVEIAAPIIFTIVAVCGVIGGALNVLNRGPIWMGAICGLVVAVGGYGAAYLWIHNRQSIYKFELAIAFIVGCLPGFGLQFLFQQLRKKMAKE